jgi:hypothetical protein
MGYAAHSFTPSLGSGTLGRFLGAREHPRAAGEGTALLFAFPAAPAAYPDADPKRSSSVPGSRAPRRDRGGSRADGQWSPERVATLTRLFAEGLSHGLIARELGVDRGAVSGKLHRLGLTRPVPVVDGRSDPAPAKKPEPVAPVMGRMVEIAACAGCRWPTATRDGVHLFCDAPQAGGSSYCPAHERGARQPNATRAQNERIILWLRLNGRKIR